MAAEAGRDVAVHIVPVDREDMAGEGAKAWQPEPPDTRARALQATIEVGDFMVALHVKVAGRSYSSSWLFCDEKMTTTAEPAGKNKPRHFVPLISLPLFL